MEKEKNLRDGDGDANVRGGLGQLRHVDRPRAAARRPLLFSIPVTNPPVNVTVHE